jgi:DNA-directed RNA polymerase subunit delta
MHITPNTSIGRLLERHPEAEEVMAWYGVDLEEYRPSLTIESLCRYARLDVDDVISDLEASMEEEEDEDWDDDEEEISGEYEDDGSEGDGWEGEELDEELDDDDEEYVDDDDEEEEEEEYGD